MILLTDIGPITIGYIESNLVCEFSKRKVDNDPSRRLALQLKQYFEGKHVKVFDAPLPEGPPFMHNCWAACRKIPFGKTISYGELAKAAGSPKAARAAGQAMRNNPAAIITPCHRVIASSGKLHGFSGKTDPKCEELKTKQYLLSLERSTLKSL